MLEYNIENIEIVFSIDGKIGVDLSILSYLAQNLKKYFSVNKRFDDSLVIMHSSDESRYLSMNSTRITYSEKKDFNVENFVNIVESIFTSINMKKQLINIQELNATIKVNFVYRVIEQVGKESSVFSFAKLINNEKFQNLDKGSVQVLTGVSFINRLNERMYFFNIKNNFDFFLVEVTQASILGFDEIRSVITYIKEDISEYICNLLTQTIID